MKKGTANSVSNNSVQSHVIDLGLMKGFAGFSVVVLLILSFSAQQFAIITPLTSIRPYMLAVITLWVFFIIISCVYPKFLKIHFDNIDFALIGLYSYMLVTVVWADNRFLSFRMVLGIIMLLLAYFCCRFIFEKIGYPQLVKATICAAKIFIIVSLAYYLAGLAEHYFFKISLITPGSEPKLYVLMKGVYYEGSIYPRLRGICDSPNNFGMYAVIFLASFALSERPNRLYILLLIIMMLLTSSVTTILAMFCMAGIYMIKRWGMIAVFVAVYILIFMAVVIYLVVDFNELPIVAQGRLDRVTTGSGRWILFWVSLVEFAKEPFFGYGLNQARDVLFPIKFAYESASTHNNLIEMALEGGLVGLGIYVMALCVLVLKVINLAKHKRLGLWAALGITALFVFSNANVNLYADSTILFLAMIASVEPWVPLGSKA